jgi:hypothetical protein
MVIIRHDCVLMLPNSLRTRTFVIYLFILRYSYSGRKTEIMAFDNEKHRRHEGAFHRSTGIVVPTGGFNKTTHGSCGSK